MEFCPTTETCQSCKTEGQVISAAFARAHAASQAYIQTFHTDRQTDRHADRHTSFIHLLRQSKQQTNDSKRKHHEANKSITATLTSYCMQSFFQTGTGTGAPLWARVTPWQWCGTRILNSTVEDRRLHPFIPRGRWRWCHHLVFLAWSASATMPNAKRHLLRHAMVGFGTPWSWPCSTIATSIVLLVRRRTSRCCCCIAFDQLVERLGGPDGAAKSFLSIK